MKSLVYDELDLNSSDDETDDESDNETECDSDE